MHLPSIPYLIPTNFEKEITMITWSKRLETSHSRWIGKGPRFVRSQSLWLHVCMQVQLVQSNKNKGPRFMKFFCWHDVLKVAALYCLGFYEEAVRLGRSVYDSVHFHPKYVRLTSFSCSDSCPPHSHRHNRFALTYHSLAMVQLMRSTDLSEEKRSQYMHQIKLNQDYVKKCVTMMSTSSSR